MVFSSITFLFYFLPVTLFLYFVVPKRFKNPVLLAASLVFYAWGEKWLVLLLLLSVAIGYAAGMLMDRWRGKAAARAVFVISTVLLLGFLVYYKYTDFFIANFNAVTGLDVRLLGIALPIGISFYTFQILSYTIDVYRGNVPVQRNPFRLATYVTLFPQLIAGPIVRYSTVAEQLAERTHTLEKAAYGVSRFIAGLGKKILLANQLGEICSRFKETADGSVLYCWIYAIVFTLQIYFDFSAYSDMAIGLGKLFGFDFPENFNYPLTAASVSDFWRRWHMTLSSWFRDYVYIPMGGNRVPAARLVLNIMVVWLLTGFWHGASWNFIIWGVLYGLLLLAERFLFKGRIEKLHVVNHIYVILTVVLGFVLFDAASLPEAGRVIGGMFGFCDLPAVSQEGLYVLRSGAVLICLSILGATPLPKRLYEKLSMTKAGGAILAVAKPVALGALLLLCTAYLVDGSYNPFLYFRF
ncbi:MAG: MBOAT family protein [Clostridia bacterium]|nr:MBOAT family protein [Clostridia bacterium]